MTDDRSARNRWDQLHAQPRYCPRYPDDLVVRWLMRSFPGGPGPRGRMLDLGCGAGRHSVLLAREGFETHAADLSAVGLDEARRRVEAEGAALETQVAAIHAIQYPDAFFDGVICYGVLNYAPLAEIEEAIARVARAVRPGGRVFFMTRSDGDWRRKYGREVGPARYVLSGMDDGTPAPAEEGMEMTLLSDVELRRVFAPFSSVQLDRRTVSWFDRAFVDDDWLIAAER